MKAVIMAGGEGSRLRPLTSNTPKPMLPVANTPMMEHIVRLCRRHGIDEIVVTVQYLASVIRNYFGAGTDFDVDLHYAVEDQPLGTAGSVGNARERLDETFLVISGDALTDIDLDAVLATHRASGSIATIVLYRAPNPLEFGIVITREDGSIERFLEKPTWGQVFSDLVNTGIYVLEPEIFDYIPEGGVVDFSQDVFPALLADGRTITSHVAEGYWEDVGTIEAYMRAQRDVLDGNVDVAIDGFELSPGVWVGEDVEIDRSATVAGPAVIGGNTRIGPGARIGAYTVLGDNVLVGPDTEIDRSTVFDNAVLGGQVSVRSAICGKGVDCRDGVTVEPDAVIGDGSFVGRRAVIGQSVKVYPFKSIEAGALVRSSVVWESRVTRSLFGARGVAGLANVDITPQLAVRLAMAYGSTLKRNATVALSRDGSRAARALKRAFQAGLNATGVHADDLEIATVPVTRFHARAATGGVTIRTREDDPRTVEIRFFDPDGADLAEGAQRKIERNFAREDYRRVVSDEMGEIFHPPHVAEFYVNSLLSAIDADAVRDSAPKVVVDYSCGTTSVVLPQLLARTGVDVLGINPYTADRTRGVRGAADLGRLGDLVRASGSAFGMRLDPDGERTDLVDDRGRHVESAAAALLAVRFAAQRAPGGTVALAVNAPGAAERVAVAAGAAVVWSPTSPQALSAAAAGPDVCLAVGDGFIVPGMSVGFDAVAEFLTFLEIAALRDEPFSVMVDSLPPVHRVHESVDTPWETKGTVMRTLVEEADGSATVLVDGVRVNGPAGPDSWWLVLPDADEPTCHVWADASDRASATALVAERADRIREIVAAG